MKVKDISRVCQGQLLQLISDDDISSLLTDSRKPTKVDSSAFFAIKGINHNGHDHINELINVGVKTFIIEQGLNQELPEKVNLIKVDSSVKALQLLAAHKRSSFKGPVVGITGSNGKTIVKEWITQMLSNSLRVISSPRSFNSQIGVPLSVWEIHPAFDLAVFEAGISTMGEMEKLEPIIQPRYGILTNIGTAHEEGFPSMKAKLKEKLKLFQNSEWLIYRADDELIRTEIQHLLQTGIKGFSWALDSQADLRVENTGGKKFRFISDKGDFQFHLPFTDPASLENLIHCIALMYLMDYNFSQIQEALNGLEPVDMRLKLHRGSNQTYIIDDSYNNDLAGLENALDFLMHQKQFSKKVLILSDLLQVSNKTELYQKVGRILDEKKVDELIGVGPEITSHHNSFSKPTRLYPDTETFLKRLPELGLKQAVVLVKGARPFHFEKIVKRLVEKAHQTVFEIDLGAITHNLNYYRSLLDEKVKIMVMVKAFAYGSGIAEIAQLLQFHKVHYLAVAYADEGVELRKNGIHLPIMVMNSNPADFDLLLEWDLEPEVFSFAQLESLYDLYSQRDQKLPVHININTGMNRLGFEPDTINILIQYVSDHSLIEVKSVFTHLAAADEEDHNEFSKEQLRTFEQLVIQIRKSYNQPFLAHALNSAGIQRFPDQQFDMVRLGIGLYGLEATGQYNDKLKTVGTLKTVVSQVKHIEKGATIGYGRKGLAERDMTIATVAIGYADGFSRAFSNGRGAMYINSQRVPVIGNVCMDMCMLNVTGLDVKAGDEVVVFGKDPSITELASAIDTIPYEILTNVSERVKRVYLME